MVGSSSTTGTPVKIMVVHFPFMLEKRIDSGSPDHTGQKWGVVFKTSFGGLDRTLESNNEISEFREVDRSQAWCWIPSSCGLEAFIAARYQTCALVTADRDIVRE